MATNQRLSKAHALLCQAGALMHEEWEEAHERDHKDGTAFAIGSESRIANDFANEISKLASKVSEELHRRWEGERNASGAA